MTSPTTTGSHTESDARPAGRTEIRTSAFQADFCVAYPKFDVAQQERFRAAISRLLGGHIITPGSAFRPDADWAFVERYSDVVEAYLVLGGWRLQIDRTLRVARVVHPEGEQRVSLGKLESLCFCVLRLIYHEQKLLLREDDRCLITAGDLRERLIHAGASSLSVSRNKLRDALKMVARYHLIDLERGFQGDDEDVIIVSPVVERVLPPERIEQFVAEYRTTRSEVEDAAGDSEDSADAVYDDTVESL